MPLRNLTVLFIGLPIIELALLFELHGVVGFMPTVLLVVTTGLLGATMVRNQGTAIWFQIQREINSGNLPAPQLLDGVMVLVAGAFLITPGLLTDLAGFSLLVPFVRTKIRSSLKKIIERKMRDGQYTTHIHS